MALPSGFHEFTARIRTVQLAREISSMPYVVDTSDDVPSPEKSLSQREDEALQIIWDQNLVRHFRFEGPAPTNLEQIKRWLTNPSTEEARSKIVSLCLDASELEAIPPLLSQLPKLRVLDLSENRIRSIPESLKTLPELQMLDLSENEISSLDFFNVNPLKPQAMFPKLDKLKLARNQIKSLHGLLNICRQLRHLDISFNPIQFDPVRDYSIGCEFVVLPSRGSLKIDGTGIDLKLIAKETMKIAWTDIMTIQSLLRQKKGPER